MVQLVNGYVLLPTLPDWESGMTIVHQWQTEIALAKRGYEDRASLRPVPQAQMAWQVVTTTATDGAMLEDQIRAALRSGQACAPCWARPSYVAAVAGTQVTLEPTRWAWVANDYLYAIGFDGTTHVCQVLFVNGTQLSLDAPLPAVATVWPLLFGRLETESPEQEAPDALALTCRLYISSWRKPNASAAPVSFNGTPIAPPVVAADWGETVNRSFAYDQAVEQIGFGAETLEPEQSYVQHGVQLNAQFFSDQDISDLESFLISLGGRRGNWWLPAVERAMIIHAGVSASAFLIDAQGLAATWGNQPALFLYFTKPGHAAQIGRILSVQVAANGTEQVTLDAALASPVDASWDVQRLRLLRLSDAKLEWSYDADGYASVQIVAVELPLEYFSAAPVVPQPAYLYAFTGRLNGAVAWYQTSHAVAVLFNGNTYLPASITHDEITRSWDSSEEKTTLSSAYVAGGPLASFLPFPPSDRLQVIIWRLDLGAADPAATASVEFQGFVSNVHMQGRKIGADVQSPIDFMARKLPGFIVGTPCNAQLYGPGCLGPDGRMVAANWAFGTSFDSLNGTLVYTTTMNQAANWFAAGHLVTGAGTKQEVRTIMSSGDAAGKYLVLNYPLLYAQPGQAVTIYPGCSHLQPDCQGKFNNWVNYQGQPLVPYRNPTLKAIDTTNDGSGKK